MLGNEVSNSVIAIFDNDEIIEGLGIGDSISE
jgi:hypothetical protein